MGSSPTAPTIPLQQKAATVIWRPPLISSMRSRLGSQTANRNHLLALARLAGVYADLTARSRFSDIFNRVFPTFQPGFSDIFDRGFPGLPASDDNCTAVLRLPFLSMRRPARTSPLQEGRHVKRYKDDAVLDLEVVGVHYVGRVQLRGVLGEYGLDPQSVGAGVLTDVIPVRLDDASLCPVKAFEVVARASPRRLAACRSPTNTV